MTSSLRLKAFYAENSQKQREQIEISEGYLLKPERMRNFFMGNKLFCNKQNSHFQIFRKFRPSGVPGIHGNENTDGWYERDFLPLKDEALLLESNSVLYRLDLKKSFF